MKSSTTVDILRKHRENILTEWEKEFISTQSHRLIRPDVKEMDAMNLLRSGLDDLCIIYGNRFPLSGPKELNVYSWPSVIEIR